MLNMKKTEIPNNQPNNYKNIKTIGKRYVINKIIIEENLLQLKIGISIYRS